jgi:SWI/SNF-related matrix-associated actin-dependent regulator 1 of chromatin subfamily A
MTYCHHCKTYQKIYQKIELSPTLVSLKLTCNHTKLLGPLKQDNKIDEFLNTFVSKDHKQHSLFKYQRDDIHVASKAFGRILYRYEVGLGKTPESIATVDCFDIHPALILTKPTLVHQWVKEIFRWTGKIAYLIKKPSDLRDNQAMLSMFPYLVMSLDLARAFEEEELLHFPTRTVIIDECQHIKNLESARTKAVRRICRYKDYVIGLSATPIKNRFDEYFPILNILRPDLFPAYNKFVEDWCEYSSNAYGVKVGACSDPKGFEDFTKGFVIHRTKDEVLPDLPKTRRNFRYYDLESAVKKAYEKLVEEFEDYYENTSDKGIDLYQNLLAFFAKMRHLTGLAKVDNCVAEAEDFLLSCSRKLTIFVHHKLVADMIQNKLDESLRAGGFNGCLHLHSELSSAERAGLVEAFRREENRVLIASTLAAGEGLNLQFCSDAIFVERQWNPANEEQAEGRFSRIGQEAESIDITYLIALGTIDEWLTELVEAKREIVKTAYGEESALSENKIVLELADRIIQQRQGKKWKAK